MNFLGGQQYLRNFISVRENVVLEKIWSFFQKKFYNTVFIFCFFMNLQKQDVTNVIVTYVIQSFACNAFETIALKLLKVLANSLKLYYIFNC